MQWGFLVLAGSGLFSGGMAYYLHLKTNSLKYLGLLLASFFFVLVDIALIARPEITGQISSFIAEQTIEWGHIFCLALVLSSLLLFIRKSKPEFSRFPLAYVTFPLIIILSYLLVYNTVVLKNWLINIYQAGAVVVSILMYGIYYHRQPIYRTVFIGSILYLITFILYLTLPQTYALAWQIALAVSTVTSFSGYFIVEKQSITQP